MTFQRNIIEFVNRLLSPINLQLESKTLQKMEQSRLDKAVARGAFSSCVYPIPPCFLRSQHQQLIDALPALQPAIENLSEPSRNQVGYQFDNGFYTSPDTEILYTIVRTLQPNQILEIGCGNSTRITRQAIIDGQLSTTITCIDPYPRRDVAGYADQVHMCPVEESNAADLVAKLHPGDVLFIDTSHILFPANDCAYIYGVLIPLVPDGVIVHIHDIFTPYEYPEDFARKEGAQWGEQYLVAMMLHDNDRWEALWPGHYLQRTLPDFASHFPRLTPANPAQSLWLRRTAA